MAEKLSDLVSAVSKLDRSHLELTEALKPPLALSVLKDIEATSLRRLAQQETTWLAASKMLERQQELYRSAFGPVEDLLRRADMARSVHAEFEKLAAMSKTMEAWVALPVKRKIAFLKNEWQAADKLFRDGHQVHYEKEAKYLYGLLREAWERALEEVLLGGVVERFRPGVQTQHVTTIADITEEDCKTLDAAMTKCSKWLAGHDQAAAARAEVPEPAVLKADIEALESWVSSIRHRRK